MKRYVWLAMLIVACAGRAWAIPTMDGSASAGDGYGTALSVQTTNTGFGNAGLGDQVNAGGGSEIDQVYGTIQNGRLYVTVTGNLEPNFNKLEVFVDSKSGGIVPDGQPATINGSALPSGVDAFCCGGIGTTDGALQRMNGLTFDAGFNPDYFLTFSNGYEKVNPTAANPADTREFWAISAHYADLTNGKNGAVVAAGMQIAPQGKPNVLRFPGDYNHNGAMDAADYVLWRNSLGQTVTRGTGVDGDNSGTVDTPDYNIWQSQFGGTAKLSDYPWVPRDPTKGASGTLTGPALPGLAQGQLIDRNYAITSGGCSADDSGNGCAAGELAFALNVDPTDSGNTKSHRNFNNTVGLQMAFDNSNTAGVAGGAPFDVPTGDPQNVKSGLEFSIPLDKIGQDPDHPGAIKLSIFVAGQGHDYLSNQFAGDGIPFDNVGPSPFPSLDGDYAGNQYVTVPFPGSGSGFGSAAVPEPGTLALVVLGCITCGSLRRR